MQNPKLIFVVAVLLLVACKTPLDPQLVKGYWKAEGEDKSLLKIDDQEMSMVYDGQLMERRDYNFQASCTTCTQTDKACLVIKEEGKDACYAIMEADGQKLAMYYTSGNGQPIVYNKTTAFEVPDPYLISNERFMGIQPGDNAASHSKFLKKTKIESGEGSFDGWDIINWSGKMLGQAYANTENPNIIDLLWITEPGAHTSRHHGIGITFDKMGSLLNDQGYELHGSEIEGRTTVSKGNLSYLLDIDKWSYHLNTREIPGDTKIKAILIRKPLSPLDGKTQCYLASTNTTNTYSLELTGVGKAVTGYLTIQQPPHHTGIGKIIGWVDGNIITADYSFQIEGDNQIEEMIFKIDGNDLYQAEGPLTTKGSKSMLKDKSNLNFSTYFMAKPCSEVAEAIGWAKEMK